ncbi:phospholipid-binding protein MlaC [Aquisalimonas sp.]|uniref:MlaC/ttg2D family ABC transporter substrate-binding protein n=1 Tax=unclassified Aquisalimonas TaxID=2644645 RepID=UPI0025C3D073|nr:ABC transporter substrate-binding protein [Aquisalimonas sp.]
MTEMMRAWRGILFLTALLLLLPVTALADHKSPEQIVRDTTGTVLEKLRSYDGDLSESPEYVYGVVREDVLPYFNFQLITRFALGRHWNDATEEQREQFTEELRTLLVRTYSQPLLEYNGEEVRFRSERVDEERGRASMQMEVHQRDGPAIPLTYQFRKHDEHGWQVYDVVVEGISLVTNYRDTFNSEIRRNGMDGLIERLRERNRRGETDL